MSCQAVNFKIARIMDKASDLGDADQGLIVFSGNKKLCVPEVEFKQVASAKRHGECAALPPGVGVI